MRHKFTHRIALFKYMKLQRPKFRSRFRHLLFCVISEALCVIISINASYPSCQGHRRGPRSIRGRQRAKARRASRGRSTNRGAAISAASDVPPHAPGKLPGEKGTGWTADSGITSKSSRIAARGGFWLGDRATRATRNRRGAEAAPPNRRQAA